MTEATPWEAQPDVFVVSASTDDLLAAMKSQASELDLRSDDPSVRFYPQVRLVDSPRGEAVVVTDIAEYVESGAKRSAVVVSGVIEESDGRRQLTIRTHLEDQHTRFDGDAIVFGRHHDAIRAAFIAAVVGIDPEATHVQRPAAPDTSRSGQTRERPDATPLRAGDDGPDARSVAGMVLLAIGALLLLVAVTTGSPLLIIAALGLTLALGWFSTRIQSL